MANYIYTRPTYSTTGAKQNKAILGHFANEWNNLSSCKRYSENRLKMRQFEQMLAQLGDGDIVYCDNPAIFGIGVEACIKNMRKVLATGARIRSVVCGEVDAQRVAYISVCGAVVRECQAIERGQEVERNRGVRIETGGYFKDGVFREGMRRTHAPTHWTYMSQRKMDEALERRESPAAMWIDMKIMQAWTTERIWAEYKDLCKVMPDDVWEKYGKQWINTRRLELIK